MHGMRVPMGKERKEEVEMRGYIIRVETEDKELWTLMKTRNAREAMKTTKERFGGNVTLLKVAEEWLEKRRRRQ